MSRGHETLVPLRARGASRAPTGKSAGEFRVRLLYRCEDESAGDWFARMTPLGLGYINTTLRAHGYDSIIGNPSAKSWREVREWLVHEKPDVVGVTVYTFNRFASWKLARLVKEIAPQCTVVVGGPHATPLARSILESHPEVDVVAMGEGELTALELVNALREGKDLARVDGIVHRVNGEAITTLPRKPIENLDHLPHPSRHYEAFGVDRAAQLQYILT